MDGENNSQSDDQRRYERVRLELNTRFMRADGSEHAGQVVDISCGGIAVNSPVLPRVGERVILYVENLGRLEGKVVRHVGKGFALPFQATPRRRERISQRITYINSRGNIQSDKALKPFFVPDEAAQLAPISYIVLQDGKKVPARVLDLNVAGVLIETKMALSIGTHVQVGRMRGLVTDRHGSHFSIDFEGAQQPSLLDARLRLGG